MYRSLHFLSILSILHSLCLAHWYCVFMWISFLCISLYFINPPSFCVIPIFCCKFAQAFLDNSFFIIILFIKHAPFSPCTYCETLCTGHVVHDFTFSYLMSYHGKNWQRQLIYYHVFIIRYIAHILLGGKVFLNTNVRECDIGFQNLCILFHD